MVENSTYGMVIYYGIIKDIIDIYYFCCFSVLLFSFYWYHNEVNEYGLTRVYFNKQCSTNHPFLLACQVYQVFMWKIKFRKMYVMKEIMS